MACTQNDTTNNIPRIVRGNDFTLKVDVKKPVLKDGETTLEDFPIEDSTDISVNLVTQLGARIKMPYTVSGSTVLVNFEETVSSGLYGLEVTGKQDGKDWRFYAMPGELLEIVEPTSSAYIPSTDTVDGYYSVTAQAGVVSISEDIIQQQANSVIEEKIGEYTDTLALKSEVEVKADKTDLDNLKTTLTNHEAVDLLIHHDGDNATAVSLKGGHITEGNYETSNKATGEYATALGLNNQATGIAALATGEGGIASGKLAHTEGYNCYATQNGAHAEGRTTKAYGKYSHTEGSNTQTSADYAHAEGIGTKATMTGTHAEGCDTTASYNYAHAEGYGSQAQGGYTHAEGVNTKANSEGAHSEGGGTVANGIMSHAEGYFTKTNNEYEHASGMYNQSTKSDTKSEATLFSVGNGTSDTDRKNAFEIKRNGDIYIGNNTTTLQNTITSLQNDIFGITLGTIADEVKEQYEAAKQLLNDIGSSITYSNVHTDTTVTGIYGMSADNIKIAIWQEDELDQGGSVTAHTIKYGLATDSTTSSFTLYSVNTKGTVTVDDTVLKASPIMYGAKLYGLKDK